MEPPLPLDDSCDFEIKLMKKQLTGKAFYYMSLHF